MTRFWQFLVFATGLYLTTFFVHCLLFSLVQRHSLDLQAKSRNQHTPSRQLSYSEMPNSDSRRILNRPGRPQGPHKLTSTNATNSLVGCTMLSRLQNTGFTYLVRASPSSQRLDLAAVFFNQEKLKQENIQFGK